MRVDSAVEQPVAASCAQPVGSRRGVLRVVIGSLAAGGAEGHLAQVLPALRTRGWSVQVVTLSGLGPHAAALKADGVAVSVLPVGLHMAGWPRWLRRTLGAARLVAELRVVLRTSREAVTWMLLPEAYVVTMVAACLGPGPRRMVMSRRSLNYYQRRYPGFRALERRLHRLVTVVLANSRAVQAQLRDQEGVPSGRLALIRNGLDLARFDALRPRQQTRQALGVPQDVKLLCVVANLIPYKGHADLLRALALASRRLPEWRLICVGAGDCSALVALAEELDVSPRVLWLGGRADVPHLLAACDVALLASHEEGFSNALLEYMAAGLPVVATAVGGNSEAVVDGETGLLVPAREPQALAGAIVRLCGDATLAARMGAAGRARVEARFSLDRCVDEYDRLFRDVLVGRLPWASGAE